MVIDNLEQEEVVMVQNGAIETLNKVDEVSLSLFATLPSGLPHQTPTKSMKLHYSKEYVQNFKFNLSLY